jgi:hypothetical protein
MNKHKILLLVLAATVLLVAGNSFAGGIEKFCPGLPSAPVTEVWSSPTGVAWTMVMGPGGRWPSPGYPNALCDSSFPSAASPVLQSVFAATDAWNTASLNASVPAVSTFSFSATPYTVSSVWSPLLPVTEWYVPYSYWNVYGPGPNGLNTITLWDGADSFPASMGGPTALAVAGVRVNMGTGAILEADIAINTLAPFTTSGARYYSMVEDSTLAGVTFASQLGVPPPATFTGPTIAYVDLEGLLTHELGHFLGLGHSLVDSVMLANASDTPTMFAVAQADPDYQATVGLYTGGIPACTYSNQAVTSTLPIYGRSAADLTIDDKFAIAEGYPLPGADPYWANTGVITGTVRDALGVPVPGVSVTVMEASDPNKRRAGTLTYEDGVYTVTGLEPGNYYVQIHQVDWGYTGAYFAESDVPNFVQSAAQNLGCVGALPPRLAQEFYDVAEGSVENGNLNATVISLAGGQTKVADLVLNSDVDRMRVAGTANLSISSPRGVQIPVGATATFIITGAAPGTTAFVGIDVVRTMIPYGNQVIEVNPVIPLSAVVDGAGQATIPLTTDASYRFGNLLAQGYYDDGSGNLVLTNTLNVWVNQ